MGSYNFKLQKITYTAKEVTEELGLPFGRNTLYKHLKEMGIIGENQKPNEYVQHRNFILYNEVKVGMVGNRLSTTFVPFFTDEGIDYLRVLFTQSGHIKPENNEE